jgi:hypothetical protein
MRQLLLGSLALGALLAGLASFAANTAQWVNVTAHVEKEIEMACVREFPPLANNIPPYSQTGWFLHPNGCDYGTMFPETSRERLVELTLSRSFFDQTTHSAVNFDVLWECKLVFEDQLAELDEEDPDYNPCRNDPGYDPADFDPPGPPKLDGNIRDFIAIDVDNVDNCYVQLSEPGSGFSDYGPAQLDYLGSGSLSRNDIQKCFYHFVFNAPACEGHTNPNTDGATAPNGDPYLVTPCKFVIADGGTDNDPQDWEHSADLGDSFKVQVYGFTP